MSSQTVPMLRKAPIVETISLDHQQIGPPSISTWTHLRSNGSACRALVIGVLLCLFVIIATQWASEKVLECPVWAIDCKTTNLLRFIDTNFTIVQGVLTIVYSTGLATMAYSSICLSESAIWPLLSKQLFSIDQIETYLLAVRGSVPSVASSWRLAASRSTGIVLFLSAITTLAPLVAPPLVGVVFARDAVLMDFYSNYTVANGIGRIFTQMNPPIAQGDISQSAYIAWSLNQGKEPLPNYRGWVIDRAALSTRGNMSIRAVHAKSSTSCQGKNVTELSATDDVASFATNMASHNWRNMPSSDRVIIQLGKAVAVWVDDFSFDTSNKSTSYLVFAALNGTLEGGVNTTISNGWSISSLVCKVEVEFVDGIVDIGDHPPQTAIRPLLSSNARTTIPLKGANTTGPQTLNENALWFAVAPMIVSVSVNGSQPLYHRSNLSDQSLLSAYTRAPYNLVENDYHWTIAEITNFINVTIGAVAMASSRNNPTGEIARIKSMAPTVKLYPNRAKYLAIPMIVIIICEGLLLFWNTRLHREEKVPVMRMAGMNEILKSSQTAFFADLAPSNNRPNELSKLGQAEVSFGWTTSADRNNARVAGLANTVTPFNYEEDPYVHGDSIGMYTGSNSLVGSRTFVNDLNSL